LVHLKKIEARGFKSMGTSLISVPVEKGFVAITGPNGSGKSNLLDSILFALGENSAKTLRVPNLSKLIYEGSVEQQKPSSAKVSLQFDNLDRRIPMDSDSVTITRELKQSGESDYFINGKHAQRNNLGDLLENAQIASRGLNVVLQGMITRISELVPDEKRKLIESMVGISQFDEKKQEAMKQLTEADNKLNIAMARIEEIRESVRTLELQRSDQLRLKKLDSEIKWLRAASSSAKLLSVRSTLAEKRSLAESSSARLEQILAEEGDAGKTVSELEERRKVLVNSAVDAGTAKIEAELGQVENALSAMRRERKEASDYLESWKVIQPRLIQMRADNERKIAQAEALVESLRSKISEAEERRRAASLRQDKLKEERAALNEDFHKAQQAVSDVMRKKEQTDALLESKKDQLLEIASKRKSAEEKLVQSQDKEKFFDQNLSDARKTIEHLEVVLSSQNLQLNELQKSREKLDKIGKGLRLQLDIATSIIERTQIAVTKYDSNLQAMESVAGEEIALSRLEALAEEKALRGYLGPVRSKISYDSRYSQAVAALGRDWLNAVLVSDIDALIKTMQAAKKLKISKITAIPLREVYDTQMSSTDVPVQGMIAWACDVIKTEKRFRKVVNFIFGEAVVVDSAKNAFLAARRGYRAVTLQGDLFEPSVFAFQTGYSKKYARLSELLAKQKSFDSIKSTLGAFRSLIANRKSALLSIQEKTEESAKEERLQNVVVSKSEASLAEARKNLDRYLKSAQIILDQRAKIKQEIQNFQDLESAVASEVAAKKSESIELGKQISSMDLNRFSSRMGEISSRALSLDNDARTIADEIEALRSELTRNRGDLENMTKPALEKLIIQQNDGEAEMQRKMQLLADGEGRLQELEQEHARLKEEERKSLEIANKYKPLLEEVSNSLIALGQRIESLRKDRTSAEREVYTLGVDIERLEEREHQLSGELLAEGYSEPVPTFEGAEELLSGLSEEYNALKTNVNYLADSNYRSVFENYKYSSVRRNELEKERNAIVLFIERVEAEKREVFMAAFERIDRELRLIFNKITTGAAWLEPENTDSIFDGGIFLMTQFPGKIPRDSGSVSGGEKTISALSFILAIQAVFPSPFYVFDEVDAHLDSNYSGKLAEILAERSDRSQIIIVSLKDTVVSKAQSVIGVYMPQGSTKIIRYRSPMEVPVTNEQQS
jgi:chromosome segregation protein